VLSPKFGRDRRREAARIIRGGGADLGLFNWLFQPVLSIGSASLPPPPDVLLRTELAHDGAPRPRLQAPRVGAARLPAS
jgi:hypothetical protein